MTDGERLAILETKFEIMESKFDTMASQVRDMHELLLQAKGARWALLAMAGAGGFLSGKLAHLMPWFGSLPK